MLMQEQQEQQEQQEEARDLLFIDEEELRASESICAARCIKRIAPRFKSRVQTMQWVYSTFSEYASDQKLAALCGITDNVSRNLASVMTLTRNQTRMVVTRLGAGYRGENAQRPSSPRMSTMRPIKARVASMPKSVTVTLPKNVRFVAPPSGDKHLTNGAAQEQNQEYQRPSFDIPQQAKYLSSMQVAINKRASISVDGRRLGILLTGPAGCGKTFAAAQIAAYENLPFVAQSMSEGVTESHIKGRLLPFGSGGRFKYIESAFVHMYENGGVYLMDEVDAADKNTLLTLNDALAGSSFYLDLRPEKPIVKRHEDFIPVATANTLGNGASVQYNSRNRLDKAFLDRFRLGIFQLDYDANLEARLVRNNDLHRWAKHTRRVISDFELTHVLSTRTLINAGAMLDAGLLLADVAHSFFADWSSDELEIIMQKNELRALLPNMHKEA